MMKNASNLKNQASQSSDQPHSMNMENLSRSEAVELLDLGVKMSSEFALIVSDVISKANERARLESIKPPPAVNYVSLCSEFHDVLQSMDRHRRSRQFEHIGGLSEDLERLVSKAEGSINKNSTRDTLEEAFFCLQEFASAIYDLDGLICRGDGGDILELISEAMVGVGMLLRDKGGLKDAELKEKIEIWADGGDYEEYSFPEVFEILWGDEENSIEDKRENEDTREKNDTEASHGTKRNHHEM
jgi:hypothetical protein